MRERVEFRIPEEDAALYLPPDAGVVLGETVRKVEVDPSDPLFNLIGRLNREFRARGDIFFTSWNIRRRYSSAELERATLFHVWPKRVFEPAGEECGTVYDESNACDHVLARVPETTICGYREPARVVTCGVGARQVTPLFLNGRRIPRSVDFASTIADEIVVTHRVVEAFREHRLRGAEFDPVQLSNKGGAPSEAHYQLRVAGPYVEIDPRTRAGSNPFDEEGYGRCPKSHLIGLNILAEVTVKGTTIPKADVMTTRQMIGVRRGLLRPSPLILMSPKAWQVVNEAGLKGLGVEVAHVV